MTAFQATAPIRFSQGMRGPVGPFARQLVALLVATQVGLAAVAAIGAVLVTFWHADPLGGFPELSVVAMGVGMTVGAAAWMRHGGHRWDGTLEIAGAILAPIVGLAIASALGVVDSTRIAAWADPVMIAMLVTAASARRADLIRPSSA